MGEPGRIEQADIDDALVAVAAEDASFADLVAAAGKELKRRFDEEPDSLPGTFVIKLFLDGNKALNAGDVHEDDAPPDPDVLELIQEPGLPTERKRQLLLEEAARVRDRLADIDAALEGLDER